MKTNVWPVENVPARRGMMHDQFGKEGVALLSVHWIRWAEKRYNDNGGRCGGRD